MIWVAFFLGIFLGGIFTVLLIGFALYWSKGIEDDLDESLPQVRPPHIPRK